MKAVSLKDGLTYEPFTRLEGIPQKYTGEEPFNASDKLLNLINKKIMVIIIMNPLIQYPLIFSQP